MTPKRLDPIRTLLESRTRCYVPDSHFKVTAVVRVSSGEFHAGVNWETRVRRNGACAETSALCALAHQSGPQSVTDLWLAGPEGRPEGPESLIAPCGVCRQLLSEFVDGSTRIHLVDSGGRYVETESFLRLFGRMFRGKPRIAVFPDSNEGILTGQRLVASDEGKIAYVLAAKERSFCPCHSGDRSEGALLVAADGRCYTGSALNASNFKSSIGAITSALSRMISSVGHTHVSQVWFSASDERRPEVRLESVPAWHELETLQEFGDPEIAIVGETGVVLFRRKLSAIIPTILT